jgi:hypothetical protein
VRAMKNNSGAKTLFAAIGVTLVTGSFTSTQKVSESELQFGEVLHQQQVEGDLNGAIKL